MTGPRRVLLTRPQADSERLACDLRANGFEVTIAPLSAPQPYDPGPEPAGQAALIVTSANALTDAVRPWLAGRLVFAVGERTADVARAAGAGQVVVGKHDAAALAQAIRDQLQPDGPPLVHLCGASARRAPFAALGSEGYRIEHRVVYHMREVPCLPEAVSAFFNDSRAGAICLFSPDGARLFARLTRPLWPRASGKFTLYALSVDVARASGDLPWRAVVWPPQARWPALRRLLEGGHTWC